MHLLGVMGETGEHRSGRGAGAGAQRCNAATLHLTPPRLPPSADACSRIHFII